MKKKLVVIVMGNRNSGKTGTWNTLFGRTVRTGDQLRTLWLNKNESVEVFLVSGSAEERKSYVGRIIGRASPDIVLCSMQYLDSARQTIDYFVEQGYAIFVQWLNPGYKDDSPQEDLHGLIPYLLWRGATVCVRNAKEPPKRRVGELRDFISGWARGRRLICTVVE